ncbi:MAG: RES family NAD+ phosphorylase [Acidimicrobiales bacterium]
MDVIDRGGEYYRIADPGWDGPLDGSYSMRFGARWNAAGSFPVTYLNADLGTARANARHFLTEKLRGQPFAAEDLECSELPVLISLDVPDRRYLDVVERDAIVLNGLPRTYPADGMGNVVAWDVCQPVGQRAWDDAHPGIACRSAAAHAPSDGEELAWFDRHEVELQLKQTLSFDEWYGAFDW